MAKKVTIIKRSDGTSEEIVEQKKGFWHYFGLGFCVLVIISIGIHTPWLGLGVLGLLALGIVNMKNTATKK